jgi:hypothetical protein
MQSGQGGTYLESVSVRQEYASFLFFSCGIGFRMQHDVQHLAELGGFQRGFNRRMLGLQARLQSARETHGKECVCVVHSWWVSQVSEWRISYISSHDGRICGLLRAFNLVRSVVICFAPVTEINRILGGNCGLRYRLPERWFQSVQNAEKTPRSTLPPPRATSVTAHKSTLVPACLNEFTAPSEAIALPRIFSASDFSLLQIVVAQSEIWPFEEHLSEHHPLQLAAK